MKKKKITPVVILIIAASFLTACCKMPAELSVEQIDESVQTYFENTHDLTVAVIDVSYEQISEYNFLNIVKVSDGEVEYELILDRNNEPISDNVLALATIKNMDTTSWNNKLRDLGLNLHEYYDFETIVSFEDLQYRILLSVVAVERIDREVKDGIYSLLGILRDEGVDSLIINIDSPKFLVPKENAGYGIHSLRLASIKFDTNIEVISFEEQFSSFIDRVYWSKQGFEEKVFALTQAGYENVYFFISQWHDGNTIEIVLHCESSDSLSEATAIILLEDMDDDYFKIEGSETKYTLQYVHT